MPVGWISPAFVRELPLERSRSSLTLDNTCGSGAAQRLQMLLFHVIISCSAESCKLTQIDGCDSFRAQVIVIWAFWPMLAHTWSCFRCFYSLMLILGWHICLIGWRWNLACPVIAVVHLVSSFGLHCLSEDVQGIMNHTLEAHAPVGRFEDIGKACDRLGFSCLSFSFLSWNCEMNMASPSNFET